ncbi:uncharacterized protein OCT59_000697 [Rhizophagus irregularis]|uniref:uncharacterized protein n=1 Tax=Rhizophagus irregularis TaxID=588596 RepID=UPI00331A4B41|nr:hypothetical protein OCT59_000697 [Rhizophagus irregularis]
MERKKEWERGDESVKRDGKGMEKTAKVLEEWSRFIFDGLIPTKVFTHLKTWNTKRLVKGMFSPNFTSKELRNKPSKKKEIS